jgi:hypothetical protein
MKIFIRLVFLIVLIVIPTGYSFKRIDYRKGMRNNVCKVFKNDVLVYFIFVDSKETSPWTEFDIKSTIDSISVAVKWLELQARRNGISLNIITDYYIGEEYTTIKKALPMGSVIKSITEPNLRRGLAELNLWADNIARKAGTSFNILEKDGIPEIKNPKNKERLVAYMRDTKQVESVALLYMVNNYFRNDISISVNTMNSHDVEFGIVSYKYPSIIAQNILHLFGAADLYKTQYRRNEKKIAVAREHFPNDIMQDVYAKSLSKIEIGELTQYLIGWGQKLKPEYQPLLTDKFVNF